MFPKVSKRVLNMFWGKLFEKFLPSFPWNVESSKIFKKKYFQNSKNAQKCSQNYPNVFEGDFFEKKNLPGVPWRVEFSKNFNFFFKIPKKPKLVPESIQTCFERVLGQIFLKILCPVFHGGSSFRKFSKYFFFKIPKMPKIIPKSIQTCFERVLGQTFRKFFAQFSTAFRILENFQKNQKKIQNTKNAQNRSQKNPNVF